MSLDAAYMLVYENFIYESPTPMEIDIDYLTKKFGGEFIYFGSCNVFWEKPKYLLSLEDIDKLQVDQLLERKDCDMWKIIR